jgi:hypothetical protein
MGCGKRCGAWCALFANRATMRFKKNYFGRPAEFTSDFHSKESKRNAFGYPLNNCLEKEGRARDAKESSPKP